MDDDDLDSPRSNVSSVSEANELDNIPANPPPPPLTRRKIFTLLRTQGYQPDGFHSYQAPDTKSVGLFTSKRHAYAAAIALTIREMERISGDRLDEFRAIAHDDNTTLKERYEAIRDNEDWFGDSEVITYEVKQTTFYDCGDDTLDERNFVDRREFQEMLYQVHSYLADLPSDTDSNSGS